jgi:hypothetical protein
MNDIKKDKAVFPRRNARLSTLGKINKGRMFITGIFEEVT